MNEKSETALSCHPFPNHKDDWGSHENQLPLAVLSALLQIFRYVLLDTRCQISFISGMIKCLSVDMLV